MKFVRVEHRKIDRKKWDRVVSRSEYPSLFASTFYLDAVSPGWEALVKGDYETVFPLTKKTKLGYTYLPQPHFTGQLGLYGKVNEENETELIQFLKAHYRLVEVELNYRHNYRTQGLSEKCTYIIDYNKKIVFNENTRRNIQKAKRLGLKLEVIRDRSLLSLSKKHLDPFILNHLKIDAYGLIRFHSLLKSALENNQLCTYTVRNQEGLLLAMAHFIFNRHSVLYLKGTNFDKEANSGSMHLLMSRAIEDFNGKVAVFDFSGGSLPNIARFFKGLGGEPLYYPIFRYNKLPGILKLLKGMV